MSANTVLANRLAELASLRKGWYWYGEGEVVPTGTLDATGRILDALLSEKSSVPLPSIGPLVEGGLRVEWNAKRESAYSLDMEVRLPKIDNKPTYEAYAINLSGSSCNDLSIETDSQEELLAFLRDNLPKIE